MQLFVKEYIKTHDEHICIDDTGKHRRVDIMVDGGLKNKDPLFYVGKYIECSSLHAYTEIANDVRLDNEV